MLHAYEILVDIIRWSRCLGKSYNALVWYEGVGDMTDVWVGEDWLTYDLRVIELRTSLTKVATCASSKLSIYKSISFF